MPQVSEPLPRQFYSPSAKLVARRLLGHFLFRNTPEGLIGGEIVETEAYLHNDPACHAFGGQTARNQAMYGEPGHAYVYFIYGNHFCFNAVCREKGYGEAVLIRAIEATVGRDIMMVNRPAKKDQELTNGPGKLCSAMAITRSHNGADICDWDSEIWIGRNNSLQKFIRNRGPVEATPRIGITKAADLPLRFCLTRSPFLSRPWHP